MRFLFSHSSHSPSNITRHLSMPSSHITLQKRINRICWTFVHISDRNQKICSNQFSACASFFGYSIAIWAGCVTSINQFTLYPVPGFEHSNQIYERNILKKVIKSCRVLQNSCQKLFQYLIRFLYPYSGSPCSPAAILGSAADASAPMMSRQTLLRAHVFPFAVVYSART